jgi:hypothetical protein
MRASRYSFIIEEGATFNLQINWTDSEGSPIDLTDYHARMQIRPSVESEQIILQLSSSIAPDGTGISLNGSDGETPFESGSIGIHIAASASEGLTFREAYYDLELVTYDVVIRLLEGKVQLSKNVTR